MALLELNNIGRRFGHIVALKGIDFTLRNGEVLALLGDNGAGKSTLIKVITGVYPPSSGVMYFEGRAVRFDSPQDARDLGIETVYQDLALVPSMSIARNFFLGRELTRRVGPFTLFDQAGMDTGAASALGEIGIHIRSAKESVALLSGGERQSISIARALHFGTRVLILDEPTSALSVGETRKVLGYIAAAKEKGLGVIFITHNISHVFEVADRATILSHGKKVGDFPISDVTQDDVAAMVMGQGIPEHLSSPHQSGQP